MAVRQNGSAWTVRLLDNCGLEISAQREPQPAFHLRVHVASNVGVRGRSEISERVTGGGGGAAGDQARETRVTRVGIAVRGNCPSLPGQQAGSMRTPQGGHEQERCVRGGGDQQEFLFRSISSNRGPHPEHQRVNFCQQARCLPNVPF